MIIIKVYIIAEAGVNHNGNIDIAKKLIYEASIAGADAVKFQTFKADDLVTKDAKKANYQMESTKNNDNQYDMLKELELSYENHKELINVCKKNNIDFLTSPFGINDCIFLKELALDTIKIPSGEINNVPYLKEAKKFKNIILSTGMSTLEEVAFAVNLLKTTENNLSLLHCNSQYPTPYEDVNLKAINTMYNTFHLPVGYSDHTIGLEISVAAVALGATIIEKHFTLDKNFVGPDHKASMNPTEFKALVNAIRNVEKSFGDGIKKVTDSEKDNIKIVRKSIFATKPIKKGDILTNENITTKRPDNGISAAFWDEIIGSVATKDFNINENIKR